MTLPILLKKVIVRAGFMVLQSTTMSACSTPGIGEGKIAGMPIVGSGDCLVIRADKPEKGIATMRCHLNLRGLPAPYVKGLLTSSTIYSKALLGADTDPGGYTQSSIATIRLWRAR